MVRRLKVNGQRNNEHGSLVNGECGQAAWYRDRLCVEMLKGMRDTILENDMNQSMKYDEQSQGLINSLVVAGHPEQWDKPRRGSMGTEGSPLLPKGILANVNKFQWGNVQQYFDEVTHIDLPAKLVEASRAEAVSYTHLTLPNNRDV